MQENESKKIGYRQAVKSILILVIIAELYWMFNETRGDFANGILFYMYYHENVFILLFYLILFICTYLFGQRAGFEILILNKNFLVTGLKYSAITSVILIVYCAIALVLTEADDLKSVFFPSLLLFLLTTIAWLVAAHLIKRKRVI
jgi:hypothetical protein